jgi:hypothetical protein
MTARGLTAAEQRVREHVMAINMGRCVLCPKPADNFAHRLPEGQGGPFIIPNGLPLCGFGNHAAAWMCHGLTESRHRALSYACGWLIRARDGETPAERSARIATTPALIRTPLGADWHILDHLDADGRPVGMPRLAEPGEIPAWMFRGTYTDAVHALQGRAA